MGQRHQLFVIAKINSRYRTLCAVHHQWLYGHTALKRCLDTLKIFQDPTNRVPLQQEIIAAKNNEEVLWPEKLDYRDIHIHFPFIATCLTLGAGFGPEGYTHGVLIEPFHMRFNGGDNNNGITIFDITNLEHVRYCFVDFYGMESQHQVQLMAPLSAHTYLASYYDLDDPENKEMMMPTVAGLQKFDLIHTSTLRDTWPEDEWQEPEVDRPSEQDSSGASIDDVAAKLGVSSLRESSMEQILRCIPDPLEDDMSLLFEAEMLPGFHSALKTKLIDQASRLKASEHVLTLLKTALRKDTVVDLSPFTAFTANELAIIVASLQKDSSMIALNLSNRPDLTEADLLTILASNHVCKMLYLLECPQVSAEFLVTNLGQYELFHPDLLRQPLIEDSGPSWGNPGYKPLTPPDFSSNNKLSQIVWYPIPKKDVKFSMLGITPSGEGKFDNMLEFLGLGGRSPNPREPRFVSDIPVSAGKAVRGLLRLLPWVWDCGSPEREFGDGIAFAFATVSFPAASDDAIGMLSAKNYSYPRRNYHPPRGTPAAHRPVLSVGQWAIIIVHEAYNAYERKAREDDDQAEVDKDNAEARAMKRMRYALVTPVADPAPSEKRFRVVDVPEYVKEVLSYDEAHRKEAQVLTEYWNKRVTSVPSQFYDKDDIHQILDKVYPIGKDPSSQDQPTEESSEESPFPGLAIMRN
ncbi:MAG: hypothetical protein Q9222_002520 [Ikaeria aurantiellina]